MCRSILEEGISAQLTLPSQTGGLFSTRSSTRKVAAWLRVDFETGELCWSTLEQRGGQPVDSGRIPMAEVLTIRNTGLVLEMALKGQSQPTVLDFDSEAARGSWHRYLELATEVLTPESEKAEKEAAKASYRQREMEERRALNEERRKKLSENLGMRFTAEAMIARNEQAARK